MQPSIPNTYINPKNHHVGVSKLRLMNASNLRELNGTIVIQENDKPLAVLVKYEEFLKLQQQAMAVLETHAVLNDDAEASAIWSGLEEAKAGKTKTLDEIRKPSKHPK